MRQPIGGDFGLSSRLAGHFLEHPVWESDVARFGVDIWMTTTAITGGFKVGQAFLGAKIHDAKDPGLDFSAMLTQVVGSVFGLMETHEAIWRGVHRSLAIPTFGLEYTVGLEPVNVNVERMVGIFETGVRELAAVWETALGGPTFAEIAALAEVPAEHFRFPSELWVRSVFGFAAAHHHRTLNREHLLLPLTPLYLGRTASFVNETMYADVDAVEAVIEDVCLVYERMKPDLIQRWQGGGA